MKLTAMNAFQLTAEMYLTTFLADMTIYLSHELITQYSISESNLTVRHAKKIIIMKKNFLHVQQIKFLFNTLDDDSDYKDIRKAEYIIQQYDAENKISDLFQDQKNKIDIILIIYD